MSVIPKEIKFLYSYSIEELKTDLISVGLDTSQQYPWEEGKGLIKEYICRLDGFSFRFYPSSGKLLVRRQQRSESFSKTKIDFILKTYKDMESNNKFKRLDESLSKDVRGGKKLKTGHLSSEAKNPTNNNTAIQSA